MHINENDVNNHTPNDVNKPESGLSGKDCHLITNQWIPHSKARFQLLENPKTNLSKTLKKENFRSGISS